MENKTENKSAYLVGGGIVASIIASFCCIGPLILTLMGISGAAVLSKFEVIRVPMILLVVIFFGLSGFSLYRKRTKCEPGSICANPKKYKAMVAFYWIGLVVAVMGITAPYWVAWFFS
jgi:mercuric ion transport protein